MIEQKSQQQLFDKKLRTALVTGVEKVKQAVQPTFGPLAKTVLIDQGSILDPLFVDDGVTVLNSLRYDDRTDEMVLRSIRKVAREMHRNGGDGRTTAIILAAALVRESMKELNEDGSNVQDVVNRLEKGLEDSKKFLESIKIKDKDYSIKDVAKTACLDEEASDFIVKAFDEVGDDGIITVEDGTEHGIDLEITNGMKIDKGLINPYFINDVTSARSLLFDVSVLVADYPITTNEQIIKLIDEMGHQNLKNLVVFAPNIEGYALATLNLNQQRGLLNVAVVMCEDELTDIATLTGATIASQQRGDILDECGTEILGSCDRLESNKDQTIIVGGKGSQEAVSDLVEGLKKEKKDEKVQKRIANLTTGSAVIKVNAPTDVEKDIKKDKIEDAISSVRLARKNGLLAGGGLAMYLASLETEDPIFANSLKEPINTMAKGCNLELWESVLQKGKVYNFLTKKEVSPKEAGIFDSYSIQIMAIEGAVSIAKTIITCGGALIEKE